MESNIRLLRISNEKLEYQMEKAAEKAKEDSATIEQLRTDLQEKTRALSELEAAHEVPGRYPHGVTLPAVLCEHDRFRSRQLPMVSWPPRTPPL